MTTGREQDPVQFFSRCSFPALRLASLPAESDTSVSSTGGKEKNRK